MPWDNSQFFFRSQTLKYSFRELVKGWRTSQPRTFQPQASTQDLSTPDFSTLNFPTPDFSTMNFWIPWFKNSWLKSPGLKSSWLKSLGLKGPGLKLGVEKSRVEMSFNRWVGPYPWVRKMNYSWKKLKLINTTAGIEAVHQAGGLVKVAYGGALYSMSFAVTDQWVIHF